MARMSRSHIWLALLGFAMATPGHASPCEHVTLGALGHLTDRALAQQLGLGPAGALAPRGDAMTSAAGHTLQRTEQTLHGIPVYGCGVVVERDAGGRILGVRGELARGLDSQTTDTHARISAQQAVDALRRHQGIAADGTELRNVQHRLYIDPRGSTPVLVYQVSFLTTRDGQPQRPTAMVNAIDGRVLQAWDGLTTGDDDTGEPPRPGGIVGPRPVPPTGKDDS